ncbi:MAG: zinc-binding alcohol dehydrogenase [Lentisphaerae bacterium]|nr:zinc-binding alcohol dehydrogenase [Lentisphaerota bacterium]
MEFSVVYFPEKEVASFEKRDMTVSLHPDQLLIKTDYDLISAGTELANFHALPNTGTVGNNFPYYPGYSASGHVIQTGSAVKKYSVGDKVVVSWAGHRSLIITGENVNVFPVPEGFDMKIAAAAHLCSFPLLAIRKLQIQLGEACLVAGQGLLGILAGQLARIAGAYPVIVSDCSPQRRELALKLGTDFALDPTEPDYIQRILKLTGGKGPETVVEVTGNINALLQCLECVADNGRISLLGCTRISDQTVDFYKYVHRKGGSLIGTHTFARPKNDRTNWGWSEFDDYETFFKLVNSGRLNVDSIISKIASPEDAKTVYEKIGMLSDPPLGILLDWTNIK